jgi:hypothetical protein
MEKMDQDFTHMEKVTTHTPPSELERGQQLAPTVSRGRVVHEKVQYKHLHTIYATHTDS